MKLNKYFPFVIIYFFMNSVGLPLGLTYMALLGPFFYVWVLLKRKKEVLLPFLAILSPFIVIQLCCAGVDLRSYGVSFLNIIMIYFFGQAVYTFLKEPVDHEKIFKKILIINFLLCLVAMAFYFTPYYDLFWIRQNISKGVGEFLRLKMFTYEASYYALLFVPVFLFYMLQYMLRLNSIKSSWLLVMIFLPMALSFSIGVTGCLLLAGFITLLVHFRNLAPKRRVVNSFIAVSFFCGLLVFVLFFFFRENPIFLRLENILAGQDTSGKGRTANAFMLVKQILEEKNAYFGIGPGQLKMTGEDIIRTFYLYYDQTPVAIPNAAAETLLLFGWIGFSLRILIQVFLFFYTKTASNYFRLILFLFMVIYQFTGSYITNTAEYVIWVMAFTRAFPAFDVKRREGKLNNGL